MFKKGKSDERVMKKSLTGRMNSISYDERFTRATPSVDLAKSTKFIDIDDGITKGKRSELERLTR